MKIFFLYFLQRIQWPNLQDQNLYQNLPPQALPQIPNFSHLEGKKRLHRHPRQSLHLVHQVLHCQIAKNRLDRLLVPPRKSTRLHLPQVLQN